jgi:hypothetical protein
VNDQTGENFVTVKVGEKTYAAFWDVSDNGHLLNVHFDGKTYSTQPGPSPQVIARMMLRERLTSLGILPGPPCDDIPSR